MSEMTRREVFVGLSAMAAMGVAMTGESVEAQTPAEASGAVVLSEARVYPYDQMPVRKMANGGESRDVLRGALPTGEVIAVHESEQPAGTPPNPLHKIQHW